MSQQTKSGLMSLIMAILIMLIASVIAYFIGGQFAKMFILTDAAAAGVVDIPTLSDWKNYYFYLVQDTAILATLILLIWTALTHWGLRISSSKGVGKRWLWLLLGIIVAVLCVVVPLIFEKIYPLLIIDMSIPVLFLVCFTIVGYWGGSIIVTSNRYKYTPFWASIFR